jgi:hypothetical protein
MPEHPQLLELLDRLERAGREQRIALQELGPIGVQADVAQRRLGRRPGSKAPPRSRGQGTGAREK